VCFLRQKHTSVTLGPRDRRRRRQSAQVLTEYCSKTLISVVNGLVRTVGLRVFHDNAETTYKAEFGNVKMDVAVTNE